MTTHQSVLILDFGSQVTQLIARRVREAGVYCEIVPFDKGAAAIKALDPAAIILSGGPASVIAGSSPSAPDEAFTHGVPVLGICYGQQTMVNQLGGRVENADDREFGRAYIDILKDAPLLDGVWTVGAREEVWMSHGDRVMALPEGFEAIASSEGAPYAAIADVDRKFYGLQFHPEVVHTPDGAALIGNFLSKVAGLSGDWTMGAFRERAIEAIRKQVGDKRVICGVSGGVDSSVAAVLLHEAIGDQIACVFVDNGLLRAGEAEDVVKAFRDSYNIPLVHNDATDLFLDKLTGVTDPEQKRKIIGATFIDVFEAEAKKIGG
ncbi:MAG: glutamine-hydrolyzing GMP synthase, partial [Rhodospirillales bacterium]|nr:glutamine-hydrolyzing GMP synthase [Rhodospirillales bacterium]